MVSIFLIFMIVLLIGSEFGRRWAGVGFITAVPWNLLFIVNSILCLAAKLELLDQRYLNIALAGVSLFSLVTLVSFKGRINFLQPAPLALLLVLLGLLLGWAVSDHTLYGFESALPTFLSVAIAALALAKGFRSGSNAKLLSAHLVLVCGVSLGLMVLDPDAATTNFSSLDLGVIDGRLSGLLFHPNALGPVAAIAFAMVLCFWRGVARVAALALTAAATVLTDQRSALIAIVAAALAGFVTMPRKPKVRFFLTSFFALSSILFAFTAASGLWTELLDRREDSVSTREAVYALATQVLPDALPFGIGPNGFYNVSLQAGFSVGIAHAHNSWLSLLIGGGFISGLAFLSITAWSLWKGFSRRPYLPLVVTVVFLSLVESPVYAGSNSSLILVATAAFMVLVAPAWTPEEDPGSSSSLVLHPKRERETAGG